MSEHKRQLQLSSSGHTPLSLSVPGSREMWGGCLTARSLFHLRGLERHPQQNSFPSLLGLGSGKDQVQPALYRCLVPSETAGKEKRGFCAPGVAKVAIRLACAWYRLPCEG